jgi:hypothetical protein
MLSADAVPCKYSLGIWSIRARSGLDASVLSIERLESALDALPTVSLAFRHGAPAL